jgi:hypothetical protein
MKQVNLKWAHWSLLFFAIITTTCTQYKKEAALIEEYIETIEEGNRIDLNYKSVALSYVDTLTIGKRKAELVNSIQEIKDHFLSHNKPVVSHLIDIEGDIFTKSFLTKEKLQELREWERQARKRNDPNYDYYAFLFTEDCYSAWCEELRNQLTKTDEYVENYDSIQDGDLDFINHIAWYYKRIDQFGSNGATDPAWEERIMLIDSGLALEEHLSKFTDDDSQVIHYVLENTYTILNPALNTKQELTEKFLLGPQKDEILGYLEE